MAKIVRLTERDMSRLVRKVIKEQRMLNEGACLTDGTEKSVNDLRTDMQQLKKQNAVVELQGSCLYVTIGQTDYLIT